MTFPENENIVKAFLRMQSICAGYSRIAVSVSGGSDSDIMIDMFTRLNIPCEYIFIDTGVEYRATYEHLDFLEDKYNIKIHRLSGRKIPPVVKEFGIPFLSKRISENIARLQHNGFKWEEGTLEELHSKYPKCKSALRWWCSDWKGSFSINNYKLLKEFMQQNPPEFKISSYCCDACKKATAHKWQKEHEIQLVVTGIRRAEGGVRSARKSCFEKQKDCDNYAPLFFFTNADKAEYKEFYGVQYSDCYEVYGMKRTGCVGCPFNRRFMDDLKVMQQYEPQLYKLAMYLFKDSYEYTTAYKKFRGDTIEE